MSNTTTVLADLKRFLPENTLDSLVSVHKTDRYCKSFTTKNLLIALLTAQSKNWNSLREVETGFLVNRNLLYHLGISSERVCRSTMAQANSRIKSCVFEGIFYSLVKSILPKIQNQTKRLDLERSVQIIDSTTIDLCLSVFPWAKFRETKGAIKIHTTFDLVSQIPMFVTITNGKKSDVKALNVRRNRFSDSIYLFDRGYQDFDMFFSIHICKGIFVTRLRRGINYQVARQHNLTDRNVLLDAEIDLPLETTYKYPAPLRLVRYRDPETGKVYDFITNSFEFSSTLIAQLYKQRWTIELFFKWMKQNLQIKTFLGTSFNAVRNQIWVALIYFVLLQYIIQQTNYKGGILKLTRMIRETLFMRMTLIDILQAENISQIRRTDDDIGQLAIF